MTIKMQDWANLFSILLLLKIIIIILRRERRINLLIWNYSLLIISIINIDYSLAYTLQYTYVFFIGFKSFCICNILTHNWIILTQIKHKHIHYIIDFVAASCRCSVNWLKILYFPLFSLLLANLLNCVERAMHMFDKGVAGRKVAQLQ